MRKDFSFQIPFHSRQFKGFTVMYIAYLLSYTGVHHQVIVTNGAPTV